MRSLSILKLMKLLLTSSLCLVFASCSTIYKVVPLDSKTQQFPADRIATVLVSEPFDLDSRKELIVAPRGFYEEMISNIGYFSEVIDFSVLEERIISKGLQDKVPSTEGLIGLSNAAKYYKSFLVCGVNEFVEGGTLVHQLNLYDASTGILLFACKVGLQHQTLLESMFIADGVDDQHTYYPLLNSLISYIRSNSKTAEDRLHN